MKKKAILPAIEAILAADHADPFALLGPHPGAKGSATTVRVFRPDAEAVAVLDPASRRVLVDLDKLHDDGFFAGEVAGLAPPFAYRLRLRRGERVWDEDDPYRFSTQFGELDRYLLAEGTHLHAYEKLGAHPVTVEGTAGVSFAVWAPNARRVSVVGDFNDWDGRCHPMRFHPSCGVWEIFLPGVRSGALYKFEIKARDGSLLPLKTDPYAFHCERPPSTAAVVRGIGDYHWTDAAWMAGRAARHTHEAPMSIYEVHLGSWRRRIEDGRRSLGYRELADQLVGYAAEMGFTHIEMLPVSEHPFDGSWGYQPIGLYAPTSRFGDPDDFRYLVDACHRASIGVILDWVPGHFPEDTHGLGWFDGTHLYEHADPREGRHMDWGTLIYNFGRNEVANYLHANALFWLERFHIDGLRVDAVASMLYRDYSRKDGEWLPNAYGGRENLEAIAFLKRLNELVYGRVPGAFTVAEESTAWPAVSRPVHLGGLGFGFKWNLGWMHDTLGYMGRDPVHRKFHHHDLTFGLLYAFHENFVLPLSHDEVVHGKGSILGRMPGDRWRRFANLRAYYAFMYTQPGKKLLFMGNEFAQEREWSHNVSLDWHLLDDPSHGGMQRLVRDLNRLYREVPALHRRDADPGGFAWIDCRDQEASVYSWMRWGHSGEGPVVTAANFTPVARRGYRVGVPRPGYYTERLNTDAGIYGGSNLGNLGGMWAEPVPMHGQPWSVNLTLPPLAVVILIPDTGEGGPG